ncbi:hypothetical protein [Aromatoleum anaerobium]|uniref:Uncharacterized protein n=1 Tax=Aromatoleum anaerobium TaxID=182180 RepID=A0ABX1PG83_9RHOO|nr:hypothetical protein [Aromatoleum anaerobium]MCK0507505.1 hypothetical protein [Aromatoleum anaerobium]
MHAHYHLPAIHMDGIVAFKEGKSSDFSNGGNEGTAAIDRSAPRLRELRELRELRGVPETAALPPVNVHRPLGAGVRAPPAAVQPCRLSVMRPQ